MQILNIEDISSINCLQKKSKVPWSHILRSRGMYAIIVAHIGQTWGQLILYSEVPAFMDKIMGMNIKAVSIDDWLLMTKVSAFQYSVQTSAYTSINLWVRLKNTTPQYAKR